MLPRVLEPEVMDSPEEALDYDEMDHGEVNRQFVDATMRRPKIFVLCAKPSKYQLLNT